MKELIRQLNEANKAYYDEDREIMSNYEYDQLYDKLKALEEKSGIVLSNSPTQKVGYEVVSKLPKETHQTPMLSLDKTKEIEGIKAFIGKQEAVLSWKLDGLTIVLTYQNGELQKAVTRGNGTIGEVVTNNARAFKNLPLNIPYKDEVIVRGEAVIGYQDFNQINDAIPELDQKYKNPRNLCSGSVRQLNSEETAKRSVQFIAFALVSGVPCTKRTQELSWLKSQGFDVVDYKVTDLYHIPFDITTFESMIMTNDIPSDGLVLQYNDIAYGQSLGQTSKFPRDSMAFKWEDEVKETLLREIEWSASRTGLINPVAIFDPIELEGTTVSRASVHNISIMEGLNLAVGDTITVFKANMIIPQIADNLTRKGVCEIPKVCPVCGKSTSIRQINKAKTLHCENPNCQAKHIGSFVHFVKRDAMNIDGLSEATLEKLIGQGFIRSLSDIFKLERYKEQIITMEGFGEKSYTKLIESVNKARVTTFQRLLYALGIENVGRSASKTICKKFNSDIIKTVNATKEILLSIDDIGETIATAFVEYFQNINYQQEFEALLSEVIIEPPKENTAAPSFNGLSFVITGSVEHFKNRNEIKELIEDGGGKVTGSITNKTNYLINNDINSTTTKNKKAKELGIPIITETEFLAMMNQ